MDVTLLPSDEITPQDRFQDAIINADHCLNWKSVNLGHLSKTIDDVALVAMARNTPRLEMIDLTYCESITEAGLLNFIGRVPELSEIILRRCSDSTTDAVMNWLALCCRRLSTLDISFCERITDHGITALTAKARTLQRLSLYGCNWISNDGIATLANNCPHLQHLNISKCCQLTDHAILSLAQGTYPPSVLQGLEAIGLVDLSYDTTVMLLESCRKLKLLDVRSCRLHIPTPGSASATNTSIEEYKEEIHQDISTRSDQWKSLRSTYDRKQNETYGDSSPSKLSKQEALSVMFPHVNIVTKWMMNKPDDI